MIAQIRARAAPLERRSNEDRSLYGLM